MATGRIEFKDGYTERCFSCGRTLSRGWYVRTSDEQLPIVGPECVRRVNAAGPAGYQPTHPHGKNGPRLFPW